MYLDAATIVVGAIRSRLQKVTGEASRESRGVSQAWALNFQKHMLANCLRYPAPPSGRPGNDNVSIGGILASSFRQSSILFPFKKREGASEKKMMTVGEL